jgi:hypothetical protein
VRGGPDIATASPQARINGSMSVSSPLEALRFVALALSPSSDPEVSGRLRAMLSDGPFDAGTVARVASQHLVTPALQGRLARRGLLGLLESDLADYLGLCADLNRERNHAVRRTLLDLGRTLNRIGIEPVALKGSALLLTGVHADLADRILGDIDVLLPRASHARAEGALIAAGYLPLGDPASFTHHHHAVPLGRPDDVVAVELHREVLTSGLQPLLPSDGVRDRARPLEVDGVRLRVPSPEDLLTHNIVHHNHARRLLWSSWVALRDAHDLAHLVTLYPDLASAEVAERLCRRLGRASVEFYVIRSLELFGVGDVLCRQLERREVLWRTRLRWWLHERYAQDRLLALQNGVWQSVRWLGSLTRAHAAPYRAHLGRKILKLLDASGAARK